MGAEKIIAGGIIVLLMLPIAARAAEPLSWPESVEIAAKNNAELKAAQATVLAAEYQEGSAASGFYPQISGGVGLSRGNRVIDDVVIGGDDDRYSATLSATQNLFNGYGDRARVQQARANTRAAAASLQIVKARISFELKSAFEGLLYAQAYQELTEEIIRRRQENLRLVELRFESGRENKGSVLLSQAYLEQARYNDLQARNAEGVARAQLAQALGLEKSALFDIRGAVPIEEPPAHAPDFPALAEATPSFIQASAQEDAAESTVTVTRSRALPTLDLTGTTGRSDTHFLGGEDNWTIGLNLAIPLFTGGRNYYDTRTAQANWAAAINSRESVNADVAAQLAEAFANYREAVAKLRVDDSFRQAAILRAEIARKRYNNGLLSFEDWDLIENDLISRQTTYLQSRRNRVIAEAAWEQAQGKGAIP